jgi:ribosome biogenesis SPOUT family RNA methylase Rps3
MKTTKELQEYLSSLLGVAMNKDIGDVKNNEDGVNKIADLVAEAIKETGISFDEGDRVRVDSVVVSPNDDRAITINVSIPHWCMVKIEEAD